MTLRLRRLFVMMVMIMLGRLPIPMGLARGMVSGGTAVGGQGCAG